MLASSHHPGLPAPSLHPGLGTGHHSVLQETSLHCGLLQVAHTPVDYVWDFETFFGNPYASLPGILRDMNCSNGYLDALQSSTIYSSQPCSSPLLKPSAVMVLLPNTLLTLLTSSSEIQLSYSPETQLISDF